MTCFDMNEMYGYDPNRPSNQSAGTGGSYMTPQQQQYEQNGIGRSSSYSGETGRSGGEGINRRSNMTDRLTQGTWVDETILSARIPIDKIIFEAPIASSLISHYVGAVSGTSLYRKTSFLLDAMGKPVWAPHITIKEDPFIPGAHGSSPFDEEGVKVSARTVVKKGVVNGYFLSTYSGRKLGMPSTGNAGGTHNLQLTSTRTVKGGLEGLLQKMDTGLLVTEMMGQGVNGVTGDYSRGVFGYWVENGVIVHPVEEITIAGNVKDMFKGIVAMADDAQWWGSKHMGSVLIDSMTLAGN